MKWNVWDVQRRTKTLYITGGMNMYICKQIRIVILIEQNMIKRKYKKKEEPKVTKEMNDLDQRTKNKKHKQKTGEIQGEEEG